MQCEQFRFMKHLNTLKEIPNIHLFDCIGIFHIPCMYVFHLTPIMKKYTSLLESCNNKKAVIIKRIIFLM